MTIEQIKDELAKNKCKETKKLANYRQGLRKGKLIEGYDSAVLNKEVDENLEKRAKLEGRRIIN